MLVIIPCGKKKAEKSCPAGEMYLGPYHRLCREYADKLVSRAGGGRILILSAKHGLLPLQRRVEPYQLRMGEPGSAGRTMISRQALELGLLDLKNVVVLGGRDYSEVVRQVWPHCQAPLAGIGGIGKQLAWLKERINA